MTPAADDGADTTVVRGGLQLMLAKLVHTFAGFGLFFFLAEIFQRAMGVDGTAAFGVYGTLLVIVNPLNMMFAQGTLQLVSRTVASRPELNPADVFKACARVQLPFVLGFLALFQLGAPYIAENFLNDASYTTGLRIGGVIPLCYAVRCLYQGYCNGTRRFREQSWIDMGSSTLRMLLVLGGAAAGFGAVGALLGFVAAALIMMVVAMVWIRPVPGEQKARIELRELFAFQGKVLAVTLVTFFLMSLDQVAVKALAHSDPAVADRLAGYFTGNLKIAQIPWGIISALVWVLFPLMAENSGNKQKQLATLRQGFRLVLLLLVPVCAVLHSTAHETYGLVFGSTARRALELGDPLSVVSGPLEVLSIGYLSFGLLIVASMLITAQGRAGTSLLIMSATLGLCRLLTTWLVVEHGPVGAAVGSAIGWSVGLVAACAVLVRSHGAIVSGLSVLRIGLAGVAIWGVAQLVPGSGLMLLPRDASLGLVYAATIFLLREVDLAELKDLARAIRGRRAGDAAS
jgi:O-antigen/teichoic acid export membrane protein